MGNPDTQEITEAYPSCHSIGQQSIAGLTQRQTTSHTIRSFRIKLQKHGGALVSIVVSQQKGPGFKSADWLGPCYVSLPVCFTFSKVTPKDMRCVFAV